MGITVAIDRGDRTAREVLIDMFTEVGRRRALTDQESRVLEKLVRETAPAPQRTYRWTPERDDRLWKLHGKGLTAPAIGIALDVTAMAVRDRLKVLRKRRVMTAPNLPRDMRQAWLDLPAVPDKPHMRDARRRGRGK